LESFTILCLDDHEVVQYGIRELQKSLLPHSSFLAFSNCNSFQSFLPTNNTSILIADACLPDGSGVELAKSWRGNYQNRVAIVYTQIATDSILRDLEDKSIDALVLKSESIHKLGFTIQKLLPRSLKQKKSKNQEEIFLSPQEKLITKLICKGYSQKNIANFLNISLKTVESHRTNINRKIGRKNIADLVLYAQKNGILFSE